MTNKNMARLLFLLRDGEIDFRDFVSQTRHEYRKMAAYLLKRWTAPEWFTLDDLEQELYAGAWYYVWRWEPDGATIDKYVAYNAMNSAKRALHVARGVVLHGRPDHEKSKFEKTFASFSEEDANHLLNSLMADTPHAEEDIIAHETRAAAVTAMLKSCETKYERYALLAIREGGSLDNASSVLYEDTDHRARLHLNSEEHAERFVYKQARAVARRNIESCVRPV